MSLTPSDDLRAPVPPSVVILGNDAQLAARPATPLQLAHACLAAGYRAVVPASWGEELIAVATARLLCSRGQGTAIHCACPHVARRVLAVGTELSPFLISLVSPPVATARYVRRHSPAGVRITYVGRCPGAGDDVIDARLSPEELLAQLEERGISVDEQPVVFESIIPPDRRRHWSVPGGLPTAESLWANGRMIAIDTIESDDDLASELVERVLAGTDSLVDLAAASGCVCAGAVRSAVPAGARDEVVQLEPPRSRTPVVEDQTGFDLEQPLPVAVRGSIDLVAAIPPARPDRAGADLPAIVPARREHSAPPAEPVAPPRRPRLTPPRQEIPLPAALRRRAPVPTTRVVPGAMPVATDPEGRVLPRAYVARRRTPRVGIPVVADPAPPVTGASREGPHSSFPVPLQLPPPLPASEPGHPDAQAPLRDAPARPDRGVDAAPPGRTPRREPSPGRGSMPHVGPAIEIVTPHDVKMRPRSVERVVRVVPNAGVSRDAELPIAQSVEPAVSPPVLQRQAVVLPLGTWLRATSSRARRGLRTTAMPDARSTLVMAVAGAALVVGLALGFAAASRRAAPAGAARTPDDRMERPIAPSAVAPLALPDTTNDIVAPPRRATTTPPAVRRRRLDSPGVRAPSARVPDTAAAPAVVTAPNTDSIRAAEQRAQAAARAEALAVEREAIRREIEFRRARIDSIGRRVQELSPVPPVPRPPG